MICNINVRRIIQFVYCKKKDNKIEQNIFKPVRKIKRIGKNVSNFVFISRNLSLTILKKENKFDVVKFLLDRIRLLWTLQNLFIVAIIMVSSISLQNIAS